MENIHQNQNLEQPKKAPAKRVVPQLWRVLNKANKIFAVQVGKTNAVKLDCLERFAKAMFDDIEKFWADYAHQVNTLVDSRRFCKDCLKHEIEPETLAEHIVFLGSMTMRKVLREGIDIVLKGTIHLYKESFTNGKINPYLIKIEDCIGSRMCNENVEQANVQPIEVIGQPIVDDPAA